MDPLYPYPEQQCPSPQPGSQAFFDYWPQLAKSLITPENIHLNLHQLRSSPINFMVNDLEDEARILAGDDVHVGTDSEDSILGLSEINLYGCKVNIAEPIQNLDKAPSNHKDQHPSNLAKAPTRPYQLIHITDSQLAHVTKLTDDQQMIISLSGVKLAQIPKMCADLPHSDTYIYTFGSNDLLHHRTQWSFPLQFLRAQRDRGALVILTSVPYLVNAVDALKHAYAFNNWLKLQCQSNGFSFIHNPHYYHPKRDRVHLTPKASLQYLQFISKAKQLKRWNLIYHINPLKRYEQPLIIKAQKLQLHHTQNSHHSNTEFSSSNERQTTNFIFTSSNKRKVQLNDLPQRNDFLIQPVSLRFEPSTLSQSNELIVPASHSHHNYPQSVRRRTVLSTRKQPLLPIPFTPITLRTNSFSTLNKLSFSYTKQLTPVYADYVYGTDHLGRQIVAPKLYGYR